MSVDRWVVFVGAAPQLQVVPIENTLAELYFIYSAVHLTMRMRCVAKSLLVCRMHGPFDAQAGDLEDRRDVLGAKSLELVGGQLRALLRISSCDAACIFCSD
jgi:hypothetical protein